MALAQFKQREGHCKVSKTHIEHLDGGVKLSLGYWLRKQSHKHGRGTMDAKREWKRLESLGVKWNNQRQESNKKWPKNALTGTLTCSWF
jgi:hypothetical protein